MPHQTRADVVEEASRLLEQARERSVMLRLIGGVAVRLHAEELPPALAREYRDIDIVTTAKGGRYVTRLLEDIGYEPNARFNAMHGQQRLVFYDREHGRQLDVFVGEFAMCHRVPVAQRLHVDERTIPLAELLLTKLQVVKLNEKDLQDIYAILHGHDVDEHDDETVNHGFVARVLSSDWGFWRTSRQTVETAIAHLPAAPLDADARRRIADRLERLWARVEAEPKSLRWRSRAKIGERTRWYEEPEEVAHAELAPAGPVDPDQAGE